MSGGQTIGPLARYDPPDPDVGGGCGGEPVLSQGIPLGAPVVVLPDEYGSGDVTGTLAPSGLHEIAVRRESPRSGELVVHFPREDYSVIRTG